MTSYDDLDAQLAALQATLKVEVQKSQEDFDWPETPDLDSLTISKIEESSPTIQELEEVSSSSSSKSSSVTSPDIEKNYNESWNPWKIAARPEKAVWAN